MNNCIQLIFKPILLCFLLTVIFSVIPSQANVPVESVYPYAYSADATDQGQTAEPQQEDISHGAYTGKKSNAESHSLTGESSGDSTGILLNKINSLQKQVSRLQGMVEQQAHVIVKMQAKAKQRYLDVDRRLSQLIRKKSEVEQSQKIEKLAENSVRAITDAQAYKNAFELIGQHKFDLAADGFNLFLTDYPKSRYTPNVWYWLGEIYSVKGKLDKAVDAFQKVVSEYPQSTKIADATYKLGQSYEMSGNRVKAEMYLKQVISKYPDSSAAQLAKSYILTLN